MSPLTSPLHDRHVAAGAKLADFSGWSMPIEYAGGGVLAEHTAVREAVGLFDVSHLGTATVRGPGRRGVRRPCLSNDLSRIGPGQAQYTLCCDESGGVVDDLIVYLHGPDHVLLVPNAANAAEVLRRLADAAPAGVTVTDRHAEVAVLAVQGPHSLQVLELLGLPGELSLHVVRDRHRRARRAEVTVCRTGYTGEHGYELLVDADRAGELWDVVLESGQDLGIRPCGLGARDTLRTEMGYPLHGHELSLDDHAQPGAQRLGRGLEEAGVLGARGAARREGGRARAAAVGPARDRAGASRGRACRCWVPTAAGSARSPAARSRRACAPASPWRCSTPRPGSRRAPS